MLKIITLISMFFLFSCEEKNKESAAAAEPDCEDKVAKEVVIDPVTDQPDLFKSNTGCSVDE